MSVAAALVLAAANCSAPATAFSANTLSAAAALIWGSFAVVHVRLPAEFTSKKAQLLAADASSVECGKHTTVVLGNSGCLCTNARQQARTSALNQWLQPFRAYLWLSMCPQQFV